MMQRGYVAAAVAPALVCAVFRWLVAARAELDRPLGEGSIGFLWIVPYLIYHADLSRLWS